MLFLSIIILHLYYVELLFIVESKKDDTPARPAKYVPPGARQAAAAQSQLIGKKYSF